MLRAGMGKRVFQQNRPIADIDQRTGASRVMAFLIEGAVTHPQYTCPPESKSDSTVRFVGPGVARNCISVRCDLLQHLEAFKLRMAQSKRAAGACACVSRPELLGLSPGLEISVRAPNRV